MDQGHGWVEDEVGFSLVEGVGGDGGGGRGDQESIGLAACLPSSMGHGHAAVHVFCFDFVLSYITSSLCFQ